MAIVWISRQEAANRLGMSTQYVDARRRDGSLRSQKLGKRAVRICAEDVDTLLGRRTDWDAHIQQIVDAAPPLTDEQRTRLARLLRAVA